MFTLEISDDIERGTTNCEEIEDDFGVSRSSLPCKIHLTVTLENNISLIFLILTHNVEKLPPGPLQVSKFSRI